MAFVEGQRVDARTSWIDERWCVAARQRETGDTTGKLRGLSEVTAA